jgi:long-chain acyl-CoA synthetase
MRSPPDLIRESAKRYPDYPAVIMATGTFSHADIDSLSNKVAAGLAAKGIQKRGRVGFYCINSAEFVMAYVGIIKAGAVVVPIHLMQKAGRSFACFGGFWGKGVNLSCSFWRECLFSN